jgi:ubiquinone/menaquinone biosynthesis C-methylase UbiE
LVKDIIKEIPILNKNISMKRIRDPECVEAKHLINAGQFTGKDVLEIGCGSGWITWQYAGIANKVYGMDPCSPDLQEGKTSKPILVTNVSFTQAKAEILPFPSGIFDISVFSSSL